MQTLSPSFSNALMASNPSAAHFSAPQTPLFEGSRKDYRDSSKVDPHKEFWDGYHKLAYRWRRPERGRHVTAVHDGDTFIVDNRETIRMFGIDAQEVPPKVSKTEDGKTAAEKAKNKHVREEVLRLQPYGPEAQKKLQELIGGKKVKLVFMDIDQHDRPVATVFTKKHRFSLGYGINVNEEMVRSGLAMAYEYSGLSKGLLALVKEHMTPLQKEAEKEHRGMFEKGHSPMPGWEFRSKHKAQLGL